MDDPKASFGSGEEWLSRARQGDSAAWGELLRHYRPYVRAVAAACLRRRLTAKVDPSDVAQDCLQQAREEFAQFRGKTMREWEAWLAARVRNRVVNLVKHWHRQCRDERLEVPMQEGSGPGPDAAVSARAEASPGAAAEQREQAIRTLAAVEDLDSPYREVIRGYYIDGCSYADLARDLQRSPADVRQICHRGVKKLRQILGTDHESSL